MVDPGLSFSIALKYFHVTWAGHGDIKEGSHHEREGKKKERKVFFSTCDTVANCQTVYDKCVTMQTQPHLLMLCMIHQHQAYDAIIAFIPLNQSKIISPLFEQVMTSKFNK